MRTTLRRLLLFFCALRYGARLIWLAPPQDDKFRWIATLVTRLNASSGARAALHRALPHLGPLASAFADSLSAHPELAARTLHNALDALGRTETALAAPLAPAEAQRALHAALGRPSLEDVFASIDFVPIENGIAEQVHAAQLRGPQGGHVAVAIKLLRMQQVARLGDDAAVLGWVARLLERCFAAARKLQLHALAESFAAEVRRRFDLRAEAANLSQTARHFGADARLVVPDVIWDLSTDTTLVVPRIETLPIADLEGLRRRGVDLGRLAAHVVEIVVEQAFEHGFFHAALDARRLRVSIEPDTIGRLVLADCSIMASVAEAEREFFVHGATALFEQDYGRLADMHRERGHVAPATRHEALEAELRMRSEAHFAAPPQARASSGLLRQLLDAVQPFGGDVPPSLALAQQALARAESLARMIEPELDTWSVVRESFAALARKDLDHRGWIKRLSRELPHLAPVVPHLPLIIVHRLQRWHERRDAFDSTAWLREWHREERRTRWLLWACAAGGALVGAGAVWLTR